jgi:licheninase
MKSSPASSGFHSVALLWPESDVWPDDGEIDFMEILDPARQTVTATVIRYDWNDLLLAPLNFHTELAIDATQWHSWAVDWTPDHIAGYVDGTQWFQTTNNVPHTPMLLCLQLDDFGGDISAGGQQTIDWARGYPLG